MAHSQDNLEILKKPVRVVFGTDELRHVGLAKKFRLGSLEITAKQPLPTGTAIRMQIFLTSPPIEADGIVSRIKDSGTRIGLSLSDITMEVELSRIPDQYRKFFADAINAVEHESRKFQRFDKVYKVTFHRPTELIEEYTTNISQGGMFVATDDPPERDTKVEVRILIGYIMKTINVEGIVVHRVTKEQAFVTGMQAGFGVQFSKFQGQDKDVLAKHIEMLRDRLVNE